MRYSFNPWILVSVCLIYLGKGTEQSKPKWQYSHWHGIWFLIKLCYTRWTESGKQCQYYSMEEGYWIGFVYLSYLCWRRFYKAPWTLQTILLSHEVYFVKFYNHATLKQGTLAKIGVMWKSWCDVSFGMLCRLKFRFRFRTVFLYEHDNLGI